MELKKAQPDSLRDFVRDFCLKKAKPLFQHRLFYNGRLGVSWRRAPLAKQLTAATRLFRALRRWLRKELKRIGRKVPEKELAWAEAPRLTLFHIYIYIYDTYYTSTRCST